MDDNEQIPDEVRRYIEISMEIARRRREQFPAKGVKVDLPYKETYADLFRMLNGRQ